LSRLSQRKGPGQERLANREVRFSYEVRLQNYREKAKRGKQKKQKKNGRRTEDKQKKKKTGCGV